MPMGFGCGSVDRDLRYTVARWWMASPLAWSLELRFEPYT